MSKVLSARAALERSVVILAVGGVSACAVASSDEAEDIGTVGQAITGSVLGPRTKLYTPQPNPGAKQQIAQLKHAHQWKDAKLISEMINTAQAKWLVQGTPEEATAEAHQVVEDAERDKSVPVLVAYNVPFRDCAQYSAGGATSAEDYLAWIDGVAKGIGRHKAVIILEPDGLGIVPFFVPYFEEAYEWCQPAEADAASAADERFAAIGAALDRLNQQPNVAVYLDATHAAWLGVGEAAHRLKLAGIDRAAGFFLNVSNYRATFDSIKYGEWISSCLALVNAVSWWDASWCPGQYVESPVGSGNYVVDYGPETVAAVDANYAAMFTSGWAESDIVPSTHFVIDTSRNGQGPWVPPADHPEGDPQDWCNPPDRGLGLRPTTRTGNALLDAYLWIKIPGESDGSCTRWGAGPEDPVRGMIDAAAGQWFPEQALELVHLANPPLGRQRR